MKLYELTQDFQTLYEQLDEIDLNAENGENLLTAYFDTLEGIEGEFELKAENIAVFCKELSYETEALKQEKKALTDRISQKERKTENLKQYLMSCMEQIGRNKLDTPKAVISIRNNPERVQVDNPKAFIEWASKHRGDLLTYKEPEINKTALKTELKNGAPIAGVSLVRSKSLNVR